MCEKKKHRKEDVIWGTLLGLNLQLREARRGEHLKDYRPSVDAGKRRAHSSVK